MSYNTNSINSTNDKKLDALIMKIFQDGFQARAQETGEYINATMVIGVASLYASKYWEKNRDKNEDKNGKNNENLDEKLASFVQKAFMDGYVACAQCIRDHIDIVSTAPEFSSYDYWKENNEKIKHELHELYYVEHHLTTITQPK